MVDGPETEADYTPPAQAIHTAAQEEATAEVSAEAPAPEAPAREKTESAAPAQPASSTSVLAVGVTADSVRLRAAANTGSAILAELNRGTAVSVLGRQDGWYKVNYDGKTGYMSADYVTARSSAGDPALRGPGHLRRAESAQRGRRLRRGAGHRLPGRICGRVRL